MFDRISSLEWSVVQSVVFGDMIGSEISPPLAVCVCLFLCVWRYVCVCLCVYGVMCVCGGSVPMQLVLSVHRPGSKANTFRHFSQSFY